jgi:uncharacterized protein (DUF1499 family)
MDSYFTTIPVMSLVASLFLFGCTGARPVNLGVRDGRLALCPETPNCVSSQSTDPEHSIEPLVYSTSKEEALADLKKIIGQTKRARITEERDGYIRAEYTSAIWRFVDDVEFYFEESAHVIQVRSASRLGKSDFGVNRKRIEAIAAAWKVRVK